jgi:hypothetical protein
MQSQKAEVALLGRGVTEVQVAGFQLRQIPTYYTTSSNQDLEEVFLLREYKVQITFFNLVPLQAVKGLALLL